MSRIITLVSTPIYQNSLSGIDSWRNVILQTFANVGWQVLALNITFSVLSGGYITIVASVENNYSDAQIVQSANQTLESIGGTFGQIFSNANFKILSDTVTPITTDTDTTVNKQKEDTAISTGTIAIAAGLVALFLLRR